MDVDGFRDTMLSFLFLRYLSDNYETAHNSRKWGDGGQSDAGDFDSQSFAAKIADRLIRSDNVAVAHGQPDGW